ncbi:MAG TPA: hypothetical protein VGJ15_06390 [Pirellulales bacterium]|jgi:hypothetical protein
MPFTLPKLFLAVAFAALVFGGMAAPSLAWASGVASLTLVGFAILACRAIATSGQQRVFAVAATLVGLGYLLVATSYLFPMVARSLVTNYPLAMVASARGTANQTYTTVVPTTVTTYPAPTYYSPAALAGGPVPPPISATTSSPYIPGGTVAADGSPAQAANSTAPSVFAVAPADAPEGTNPVVTSAAQTVAPSAPQFIPPPASTTTYQAYQQVQSSAALPTYEAIIQQAQWTGPDVDNLPLSRLFLIGHCGWSWLCALLGGWIAAITYRRTERASLAAR